MTSRPTHKNADLQDQSGWEARYVRGQIPWDLGSAPPCLEELLVSLNGPPLRVLVPGAGYGHDALAWARSGHQVTAIDIAPSAIAGLRARALDAGVRVEALAADLFDLPESMLESFDAVWEQTCFCAIPLEQRAAYVQAMAGALRSGGVLHGLFWDHGMEQGPPWSISEQDVRSAFESAFRLEHVAAVELSAGTRQNEFLTVLRKRA